MKIKTIISRRKYQKHHAWQLVYEWEDVFHEQMTAPYSLNFDIASLAEKYRIYKHLPIAWMWKYKPAFVFEMVPTNERFTPHNNSPYVVPCIIDWYSRTEEEMKSFFESFSKHKIVLVTSRQVYCWLQTINAPMKFGHLPLSLSDKWKITENTSYEKDIDIVLMGRQNPVLLGWLKQYQEKHPDIMVATSRRQDDNYNYYTQDGKLVGNAKTHEQCMSLLRRSKVSFYSTKGMDDDYGSINTNGFSQVTPRFFESLAAGNHVIARYMDNEDTEYFELKSICPHTDSYESFEKQMDMALQEPVNMKLYSDYLKKHYTSTRVKMLEEIVADL